MQKTLLILACLLFAVPVAAQTAMDETPRDYLVVQVDGANRQWTIRPIQITTRTGADMQDARSADMRVDVERWERTGLPKRFNVDSLKRATDRYFGDVAPDGARFYFYAIEPSRPRSDSLTLVNDRLGEYWIPAGMVNVVAFPKTWVDIYESYVTSRSGDARRQAVIDWEEAHRDIIENAENTDDGFSQEERNEFASFYQQQFIYIRDRNPKLASIYDDLAAFHRARNNLDAELSTYLAALRAGVESPDRERFALSVGRIFVNRLRLYGDAIEFLQQSTDHTEARYLLARCFIQRGNFEKARDVLGELIATLQSLPGDDSVILETTPESELGRARYMLAELEFELHNYAAMNAAIGQIPEGSPSWDEARVLYCAMLLQRNLPRVQGTRDKSDHRLARELIQQVSFWQQTANYLNPTPDIAYPLDPLMARAMLIYAQTDDQFTQPVKGDNTPQPDDGVVSYINAAKSIDPLSPEPYLAEGRLLKRLGRFGQALVAFNAGLEVNPKHVLLNYQVADLHLKAGLLSVAKDHLSRCLKQDADFFPAHVMLGEIAVSNIEEIRESLLIRMSSGVEVDYGGVLVPPMKEAAAFFTGALAINPDLPATELALATLYLRLSEVVPLTIADRGKSEAVRRAYLVNARDMASKLIAELERVADSSRPSRPTPREIAGVPSPASYNVLGFALYSLGDHGGALDAFRTHIANAFDKRFVPDSAAMSDYKDSAALRYAQAWVRKIERNQRQYYEVDEFDTDSANYYWGDWYIPQLLKPDLDFKNEVKVQDGKLTMEVTQDESGVVSRFETTRPNATLSVFEAEFTRVGDDFIERGVHMTKARKASSSSTSSEPRAQAGVMLGVDTDGRVFWETREYDVEDEDQKEERKGYGIVDVADYGGISLQPDDKLTLALRRQLSEDRSTVEYVAVINNYEVVLPVKLDDLTKVDFGGTSWVVMAGFFVRGTQGAKGAVEVERVKFIYDGGLGGKR